MQAFGSPEQQERGSARIDRARRWLLGTPVWLKIDHPLVAVLRPKLFGGWEGNWVAYNVAHDVKLPHAQAGKVAFLMYPQAETAEGRRDSLDPETFRYTIATRVLGA